MNHSTITIFFIFPLIIATVACGPIRPPKNAYTEPADLVGDMIQLKRDVDSFRMAGTIDHLAKHRIQGKAFLFAKLPDKLRVDVLSPFGSTLSVLTADGNQFGLSDHREGRYMKGPATPCNIARLIGMPLPPQDIINILIGQVPLIDGNQELSWDTDGYYKLVIQNQTFTQILYVDPDRDMLTVHRAILKDNRGVVYELEFSLWKSVAYKWVPFEIRVNMPQDDTNLIIRYESDGVELNVTLPKDAWQQSFPNGAHVETVTCQ